MTEEQYNAGGALVMITAVAMIGVAILFG